MGFLAKLAGRANAVKQPTINKATASAYRSVQVITDPGSCCRAAESIAGNRFLAHEVPRLPLEGCDRASCNCSYKLFDDRRTEPRRASDIGYDIASELRTAENRRTDPGGRRYGDG